MNNISNNFKGLPHQGRERHGGVGTWGIHPVLQRTPTSVFRKGFKMFQMAKKNYTLKRQRNARYNG